MNVLVFVFVFVFVFVLVLVLVLVNMAVIPLAVDMVRGVLVAMVVTNVVDNQGIMFL